MFKPGDKIKRISHPNDGRHAKSFGMFLGEIYTFDRYVEQYPYKLFVKEIPLEAFDSHRFEICKEYNIMKILNQIDL